MIASLLNSPYTLLGLLLGLLSIPTSIHIHKNPFAIVMQIKSFWWNIMKGSRAKTCGNVVLIGTNSLKNDLEHELIHVQQGERLPLVFPLLYYVELLSKGYKANKYEQEAYKLSNSTYKEN
jgi:hypothetical protein